MGYRKFKGAELFDGYHFRGPEQVLITEEGGQVVDLVPLAEAGAGVETVDGILLPGLINCHCHLELSHLKNVIPPHTGLIDFLCSVVTKRGFEKGVINQEIEKAEKEMYDNGIVAVGDIGNTSDTASVKSKSGIRWQNFVEVLGFTDEKSVANVDHYKTVLAGFKVAQELVAGTYPLNIQRSSLVPHAPYSISAKTFKLINEATEGSIISLHNQEHPAEDELYRTGGGEYLRFFKIFGMEQSPFPVTGKSSLQSCLPHFKKGQTVILIHNTFISEEDILFAREYSIQQAIRIVYCLCPNANLYIENKLPPIDLLLKHNCQLVLGTDSYSSNWQLSIAKELQTVHEYFPHLELEMLLGWATLGGAKALQWEQDLGSFEKGKTPGIVRLHPDLSSSKRIL